MNRNKIFVALLGMLGGMSLFMSGCFTVTWTRFVWINETEQKVCVNSADGFNVNIIPGVLCAGGSKAELSFGDPVRVSPVFKLQWRIGTTNYEQTIVRAAVGMPEKLRGQTIQFSYQTNNSWMVSVCSSGTGPRP
jgi:hypothetical protein